MPHRLYGHVDAAENYSVGRWCADAGAALAEAWKAGRVPILVGGTGLYFKALTQGLSAVPPTPPEIRAAVRARLDARRRGRAARRARAPRSGDGGAAAARRQDADRPRARGAGGHRPLARRLAPRRHAGDPRSGAGGERVSDAGPRRALSPHRCPLRRHAGGRRAGGGEGARRPRASIRCCRP